MYKEPVGNGHGYGIKILDDVDCISQSTNTLGKSLYLTIFS